MRKLILLRGLPGSGKSTFITTHNLEQFTLGADTLRMLHAGPILEANGQLRIPAENDRKVWAELLELLEKRMYRGEFVIVDATHSHPRSFSNYQQLARKHRYQVYCVDFADVPFEICQERNAARQPYKVVPPLEMERMRDNITRTVKPKWVSFVAPADIRNLLSVSPTNLEQYTAVHHIGDIQGCFDPLMTYFETYGIHDDQAYIFVGDYLDRGPQNAEVMGWLLENYHRPNFIFIEGNHEAHLRNWTNGVAARSREFNLATKVQLEAAGFAPKKVHGLMYQLREMLLYNFHGHTVLVSHGGLSTLPDDLATIASVQFIKGAGAYEEADLSDTSFVTTTPAHTYQVHGHRNRAGSPTQVNERCFNLEGKIEFGGHLRTVTLTPAGFEERSIVSTIDATNSIIEPIDGLQTKATEDVAELVSKLRANSSIYEKPQPDTHISSFNFKRDVFYSKSWDELNVHARGLFVNTKLNVIVARAYEKFFNVGERPETQPDALQHSLQFPVKAWVKENGYLGLVGYDPEGDALVFASKSSLTSDFAGWLKVLFEQLVTTDAQRDAIKQYLQSDGGKTLVFEVIDPANDPHIVHYDDAKLVLLDVVSNTVTFVPKDADERTRIAELLSCPGKQAVATFKDAQALLGWLSAVKDFDYKLAGEHIEGFVLEDARGFMVKIKLPWYGFWRQMRTQLEHLQRGKKTTMPSLDINNELAKAFLLFLESKDATELQNATLLSLRREFEAGSRPPES